MARSWNSWAKKPYNVYGREHVEMTQRMASKITESLLTKSENELVHIATDKNQPSIISGTARMILDAIDAGNYGAFDKMLTRIVGRPTERVEIVSTSGDSKAPTTFEDFCVNAGYPMPYLAQVEMMQFGIEQTGARLLLGARGYGKTDYVVILGIAWHLFKNPQDSFLLVTKSDDRNASIVNEVAKAAAANGVEFEKQASTGLRVKGLKGKDHSLSAITIGSASIRGRHPKKIIMDDPVTEEDASEATRRRAQRVYNELSKLTSDILIIGQPVHKFDLYETLRPLLKKMEVPHGTIPELDHDLEAQRLAGVSEESIQASYFLNVISQHGNPLANVQYIDKFPRGSSVAFIDPSFEGGDYTAMSVIRSHFDGVAVYGKLWKRAWFDCIEEFQETIDYCGVQKIAFETNSLGEQPVILLRGALTGVGVVGRKSTGNKHSRIMALGPFAKSIFLAKDSDRLYIDHTTKYEYKAEYDDAPDSLASGMEWIGLIRGKQ